MKLIRCQEESEEFALFALVLLWLRWSWFILRGTKYSVSNHYGHYNTRLPRPRKGKRLDPAGSGPVVAPSAEKIIVPSYT